MLHEAILFTVFVVVLVGFAVYSAPIDDTPRQVEHPERTYLKTTLPDD